MIGFAEKNALKANRVKKEIPRDSLEVAAYYHWQSRGCPAGDPLADWLEAEKQLSRKGAWDLFKHWGSIFRKAQKV
jgi:hypothetical protein